jgi:hypothetical protein
LLFQTVPWERLREAPAAAFTQVLPDGSRVREESRFDPLTGRDTGHRRLELPDGGVLEATYAIRYHPLDALTALLGSAGLSVQSVWGGVDRSPLGPTSRELIVVAGR